MELERSFPREYPRTFSRILAIHLYDQTQMANRWAPFRRRGSRMTVFLVSMMVAGASMIAVAL